MADNVKDHRAPAGPKTKDSEREKNPDAQQNREGANRHLQDVRHNVFGDNTSSTGGANNPGQHGRDGGTINDVDNNPQPTEDVISGDRADDMNTEGSELQHPAEDAKANAAKNDDNKGQAKKDEIKKL